MSHELRTPLNAIFGFTDLMRKTADDDAARLEKLNIIYHSAENVPAAPVHERVAGLERGQRHFRILIVEDKLENRLLLRSLLEPLQYKKILASLDGLSEEGKP